MVVLFFLGSLSTNLLYQSVPAGSTIAEDMVGRPVLALMMLAGLVAGVAAFSTGLIALIRQKERAPLVYVATIIGLLLMLLLSGEMLFLH